MHMHITIKAIASLVLAILVLWPNEVNSDNPAPHLCNSLVMLYDAAAEQKARELLGEAKWPFQQDMNVPGMPIVEVRLGPMEVDDRVMAGLQRLCRLRCVVIYNATPKHLKQIADLHQLEDLVVADSVLEATEIKAISSMPQLRNLVVARCAIHSADALRQIARSPRLRSISCAGSTGVTDDSVLGLTELKSLERLNLTRTDVTDAAMSEIAKCPNLRSLCLWKTSVTNAGLEKLTSSKTIVELDLRDTKIAFDELEILTRLGALRRLEVSGTVSKTATKLRRLKAALPDCTIFSPD